MAEQLKHQNAQKKQGRHCQGSFLIEGLIGFFVTSCLIMAMLSTVLSCQRSGTATTNQVLAADIIQEIMDNARSMTYAQLQGFASPGPGTAHTLLVNKTASGQTPDTFFPRALEQDQIAYTYTPACQNNLFQGDVINGGSVIATVIDNTAINQSITLNVVVTWNSGANQMQAETMISQAGIHN